METSLSDDSLLEINPLAIPRGQKLVCEVTGQPARVICHGCRLTFYRSKEEQSLDWQGIHCKICKLVGKLRGSKGALKSEEERKKAQSEDMELNLQLLKICKNEAHKHLISGSFSLAVVAGLQALRYSKAVYGTNSLDVIPAYLLLAEANMGLNRLEMANKYLEFGNWAILKNPNCTYELRSQLHRNFGKLYTSQEKYSKALTEFAKDVYVCSLDHGPEHVRTAAAYYYMAKNLFKIGKETAGLGFCTKIMKIWHKALETEKKILENLTEAQMCEGEEILTSIFETRKQTYGAESISTAEAAFTLGLIKCEMKRFNEAELLLENVLATYKGKFGGDDLRTSKVQAALELVFAVMKASE
eukprot:jgi/Bigna1/83620/fgenesh1_pg.111_\